MFVFVALVFVLYLVRAFGSRELDDVTPGIACEPNLLAKSDVLWVIPLFDTVSIAHNRTWCDEILGLNKTIGLHGVYHTFDELALDRDDAYLERGIAAFEVCFGFRPTVFKPSHLAIFSKSSTAKAPILDPSLTGLMKNGTGNPEAFVFQFLRVAIA